MLVLALLALSAYFEASGATELVGAAFIAPVPSGSALPPPRASKLPPGFGRNEQRSADPIIERNPFDSVTGPLNAKPIETPALTPKPEELEAKDPLHVPACEGVNAYIITESTDRLWSVAALQGNGEPRPRMRGKSCAKLQGFVRSSSCGIKIFSSAKRTAPVEPGNANTRLRPHRAASARD